ncbi:pre-mrna-splicing factor cwf23 [Acrodontium crateriforme]|uniref:Pre-mrna-splicing factor cwf23 n=1 Tax=Acrodontium crateriforme TaxID=150365 RepID=A0AAQ3M6E9_9PEZI|nr:pre-mrna-splicing factor cwf23 [Acrodontium crateriforme]
MDDLKSHALNASADFYELLGVDPTASESEVRRAYRKTALKYHPDKNAGKPDVIEKFHLLQIAYDVLSDPSVKELYDNARRARDERKARDAAYEGRRKWMKEDLERRESGAFKRKRDEAEEEETFERELKRLAADGARRRKEREEQLRAEMVAGEKDMTQDNAMPTPEAMTPNHHMQEIDRTIKVRFPKNEATQYLDKAAVRSLFSRFGRVEEIILLERKIKVEGEKHRKPFINAHIIYNSIASAHAAVSDLPKISKQEKDFEVFEQIGWGGGREPDLIAQLSRSRPAKLENSETVISNTPPLPVTPPAKGAGDGLRRVPSFASFKGGNTPTTATASPHDITMIRLKNAERRRLEEQLRQEEAAAEENSEA